MKGLAAILAMVAAVAVGGPLGAQTQDGMQAKLSAMAFATIDRAQTIEVRLADDSDDNKALKAAIEQALAKAGLRVAAGSRYALSFDASNSLTANTGKRSTVFSVDGHKGSWDDEVEARIKLFSTGEDSVFKPRPDEGPQGTAGSVRLDMALIDRTGGKRLWQGWAQAPVQTSDTQAITRAMADPLAGHIGQAARDKLVPILLK